MGYLIHILLIRCVESKWQLLSLLVPVTQATCLQVCWLPADMSSVFYGGAQCFVRLLCKNYMNDWASLKLFLSPCKATKQSHFEQFFGLLKTNQKNPKEQKPKKDNINMQNKPKTSNHLSAILPWDLAGFWSSAICPPRPAPCNYGQMSCDPSFRCMDGQ